MHVLERKKRCEREERENFRCQFKFIFIMIFICILI